MQVTYMDKTLLFHILGNQDSANIWLYLVVEKALVVPPLQRCGNKAPLVETRTVKKLELLSCEGQLQD